MAPPATRCAAERAGRASEAPPPSYLETLSAELMGTKSALAGICRQSSSKEDLLTLASVSKTWNEVARGEHVWDRLYAQDFPYFKDSLLSRTGSRTGSGAAQATVPWYSEYKKRFHRERCWQTGNLTRKAPVILSGHLGCVFGACFLGAPFAPGTICTGAHISGGGDVIGGGDGAGPSSGGEIKLWLPNRGTTMEQIVREYEESGEGEASASSIPEGMDVETFTKREIAKSGVLSLYQLPGTAQIACTTFQCGVHILRCRAMAGQESDPDQREIKRKKNNEQAAAKGYSFDAVLEVIGQEAPCSKTFVDKQSRILAIPSYDGAVRLYRLPQWITECSEIVEDDIAEDEIAEGGDVETPARSPLADDRATTSPNTDRSTKPKIHASSTLYDNMELEVRGENGTVTTEVRMPVTALTMSDDCKRMFTGSNDTRVKLWDMQREEIVHRFEGHEGFIWNVKSLDAGLSTAISTSTDGFARRWDLRQKVCTGSINVSAHGPGNVHAVTGVALRGNGYHMAVGSLDTNVYVLDTRMMTRLYSVGRHSDKVCRAQLYEGERDVLMTTGWDRTVRLWKFE